MVFSFLKGFLVFLNALLNPIDYAQRLYFSDRIRLEFKQDTDHGLIRISKLIRTNKETYISDRGVEIFVTNIRSPQKNIGSVSYEIVGSLSIDGETLHFAVMLKGTKSVVLSGLDEPAYIKFIKI